MKRTFLAKLLFKVWVFSAASVAIGDEGHHHDSGPHGGVVMSFGEKNHLEAKMADGKVYFYLLGEDGKSSAAIAKHEGGSIAVLLPGKGMEKTEIASGGSLSELSAPVSGKGKVTALVKIKVEGKWISAKFSFNQ